MDWRLYSQSSLGTALKTGTSIADDELVWRPLSEMYVWNNETLIANNQGNDLKMTPKTWEWEIYLYNWELMRKKMMKKK